MLGLHRLPWLAVVLVALFASGFPHLTAVEAPLPVVGGNTVCADLLRRVGGPRVTVTSLVAPGVDPHDYQPVPEDLRRLAAAKLVVINGLGFEGWFDALAKEANCTNRVVIASAGIAILAAADDHDHDHHDHHGSSDPHAFNSPLQGRRYVENVREALIALDPAGRDDFNSRAAALIGELETLHTWATGQFARIPKARRVIVTDHEAMQYLARDYGLTVRSLRVAGEDGQPGAKRMAEVVAFIRAQGVRTVFLETGRNAALVRQIASEAGVAIGPELALDGLRPELDYVANLRQNLTILIEGLR